LAASSDRNKRALISAQAAQRCINVLERKKKAYSVESEITAFFAVLAMSDELKPALLGMGLCDVLVPLTSSENVEVQGNSAAALSNLSSMGLHPNLFTADRSWRLFFICQDVGEAWRRTAGILITIPSEQR
jgi:vacuolar protein 8